MSYRSSGCYQIADPPGKETSFNVDRNVVSECYYDEIESEVERNNDAIRKISRFLSKTWEP